MMPEPSLEFLGQRLKAVQDEQRVFRLRLGTIEARLGSIETHLDAIDTQLEGIKTTFEERFDRLETLITELKR